MIYVLTCDDPGLCKAPFVAEKNVSFRTGKKSRELSITWNIFVWGKLQRTDKEEPYPTGSMARRTGTWIATRLDARR